MVTVRSERPIFRADERWETGGILSAVGAFPEPGGETVRLYYRVSFPDEPHNNVLCIARSSDLLSWEKPNLGDGTNIVMRSAGNEIDYGTFLPFRILYDDTASTNSLPWSMLYWDRPSSNYEPGFCLTTSPDGLDWSGVSESPVITGANDAGSMIKVKDECPTPLGKAAYYIYQQTWRYNPSLPQDRDNLKGLHRRISIWRADTLHGPWRGPIMILEPGDDDESDVQFYWLSPFHANGGYGGLLNRHHTLNQTMDVQLVCSRDGWTWDRCINRKPLLPLGNRGRFDCGMVSVWAEPIEWRNRIVIFYSGRSTVHDGKPRYPADPLPEPATGIGIAELSPEQLTGLLLFDDMQR